MGAPAAIYARLSVDRDNNKVGIDSQLQDGRDVAERNGWTVVAEYVDRNITAAHIYGTAPKERPEYERMLTDARNGLFRTLYVWKLDRLTRQPRQLEDWIDLAMVEGLQVFDDKYDLMLNDERGVRMARDEVGGAWAETRRASVRQKRNKQALRESGKWHGGIAPYGYRVEGKLLVPSPAEVERIHEVARRMLDDRESMHSIVTDWNNRGIRTRGTKARPEGFHWRQPNLRSIMLNRSMLGETKAGVPGWEPIIDQRTFDRMHALLTDPSRKATHSPGVKGGKYAMGGGLTVCGACLQPLITHGKPSPNGKTTTLACLARVHGPSEKHPRVKRVRAGKESWEDTGRVSIAHDALEEHVWAQLIAKLKVSPRFLQRMSEQDPATDDRLDELEQERRELRAQKERAQKAYVLGIMDERDSVAEVTRLDALLDAIGKEYDSLLRLPISMTDFDPEKGIDWKSWTPGRRRAALRGFIDRIEVHPFPEGTRRTRPRFKNETEQDYLAAKWSILKEATASRTQIVWKWESWPG